MKAAILWISMVLFSNLLLVSCNNKDEGNKDTEILQAKQAFDRCVAIKGQAYCTTAKSGSLASLSEFFGQSYYYNFYGYNNYLAANPGAITYNQEQLNAYFDKYLKDASKQDILLLSNRWYQMTTEYTGVNNPYLQTQRRCTAYGCY